MLTFCQVCIICQSTKNEKDYRRYKSVVGNFEKYAASANINEEVVKEIESTFERI